MGLSVKGGTSISSLCCHLLAIWHRTDYLQPLGHKWFICKWSYTHFVIYYFKV